MYKLAQSKPVFIDENVKPHLDFLETKLSEVDHLVITRYVHGNFMRGNPFHIGKARDLHTLIHIIQQAPALRRPLTVFSAQVIPVTTLKTKTLTLKSPTASTMYLPFAMEWSIEHQQLQKIARGHVPVVLVIDLPKGFNNALVVGCPKPYECPPQHARIFHKKYQHLYNKYLQEHHIDNQSEVILTKTKLKLKQMQTVTVSNNIHNLNRYGKGWFSGIARGRLPTTSKVLMITCKVVNDNNNDSPIIITKSIIVTALLLLLTEPF